MKEQNLYGRIGFKHKQWAFETFWSEYSAKIGIFRGANVGTVADLETAFQRSQPFTPSKFSYEIGRGYQDVVHSLYKIITSYNFKHIGELSLIGALQQNNRKEYDLNEPITRNPAVRTMPQANFQLETHTAEAIFESKLPNNFKHTAGILFGTQGNVFKGLDYRALIPNFRNYNTGIFVIEQYQYNDWLFETGFRYDWRTLFTYQDNQNTNAFTRTHHTFNNLSFNAGVAKRIWMHRASVNAHVGSSWRQPTVYELYSVGVHQAAASYELGNPNLKSERGYLASLTGTYKHQKLSVELYGYAHYIDNFIYAQPTGRLVQTIGGTFPTFVYTQNYARLLGADITAKYYFVQHQNGLYSSGKFAVLDGYDLTQKEYLFGMPANRFELGVGYEKPMLGKFKNTFASLSHLWVTKQTNYPANVDFLPPPTAYGLFKTDFGFVIPHKTNEMWVSCTINNVLNTTYRDYQNRFRYFADEIGRNIVLKIQYILN
jgi:iron complex outermembrane receptor protein